MARPALFRLGAASLTRHPAALALPANEDRSLPSPAWHSIREAHSTPVPAAEQPSGTRRLQKTFQLHIGADLKLPTKDTKIARPLAAAQPLEPTVGSKDYFEGLPLKAWAERLGERVMPTVELVKEEHRRAKAAAARLRATAPQSSVPEVPHVLPLTRWAASSSTIRSTLVADDPKRRQRARLSWYHPDDTMVPRDWFKGGLLADLSYYRPFCNKS